MIMKLLLIIFSAFAVSSIVYCKNIELDTWEELQLNDKISFKEFPRYDKITVYLKSLAKKYSNIVKTFSIGTSFEGRDIMAIKITSSSNAKPAMVIDAGIHAREWIAPITALYIIHELVENKENHYLFEYIDFYIIPSLNPDGYEYTHENSSTRMWRKTRSIQPNVTCIGVDANRNFDMAWMTIGASSDPCSKTYAGPKAFSEPEVLALRDFILSLKGSAKTYITLHSAGNLILHPWGYTAETPKSVKMLKCVADAAAAAIFKSRGSRYITGSSYEVLYPLSGSSRDWAMGKAGVDTSYTIELTESGFDPPSSEIIPVGQEIFEAIKIFVKHTEGLPVCSFFHSLNSFQNCFFLH